MTDTFASGHSTPSGLSPETSQQAADVTGTLAELEHKLHELERELTSIGRRRAMTDATAAETPAEASPQPSGRLVDEAIELASPVEPEHSGQSTRPSQLGDAQRPAAQAYGPLDPQLESIDAPERARPSEAQLASLAELRRFRDRLERFARELSTEYDALLSRVMAGLTTTSAAPPVSAQSAPVQSASAQSTPAGSPPTQSTPAGSPLAQSTPAPTTPAPVTPAPEAAAAQSRENALFEGRVELGVGPFYDIGSLGAFEQRLASVPGVSEASVRRFEASHAVVDVRLAAPVALVRELRHAVESDFSVREVASGRILLTFDES
jgi:hypothetical protein